MTIIVRDDFAATGNLNATFWADAVTNFYKGQIAPHWMQADGAYCVCALDLALYDPDVDMLFHGKGEALSVPGATAANQYFEMGVETRVNTFTAGHLPVLDNPGQIIGGFRLTGGGGAIEGVTVAYTTNPAILPFGASTTFTLQQTHLGAQTTLGAATMALGSSGANPTVLTFVLRIEVIGSSVAVKINGSTVITGTTTVSQLGKGYFYIQNDVHWIPAGEYEGTLAGFFGCSNMLQYVEYGEFGSSVTTKTNNVTVSGGGSAPASAMDVTIIDPPVTSSLLFNLDLGGAGDGKHLQMVDRSAFTVGARVALPTFTGASGGVLHGTDVFSEVGATPGQFWKVDANALTSTGTQVLTGGGVTDLYPQADLAGNIYTTTIDGSNMYVSKIRASDNTVLATLTVPGFTFNTFTDARCIDNGRGYLFVFGSQSGVPKMMKIALGSFTVSAFITHAPLDKAFCAAIYGSHMYIGGAKVTTPPGVFHVLQYNLLTEAVDNSVSYVNGECTCCAIDQVTGIGYFGNKEVTGPVHGHMMVTHLPDFTSTTFYDFGLNASPVRAIALDDTYIYVTLPPVAHGGATWWLLRMTKALSGPTYLTDATWTDGSGSVQGSKVLMVL